MISKLKIFLGLLAVLLQTQSVWACSVCFLNSPNDQTSIALRTGVIAMLIVLVLIFIGFIKFFINLKKREQLVGKS